MISYDNDIKQNWRDIDGFDGYLISDLGNVLNKHGRVLKTYTDKHKPRDGAKIRLYIGKQRKVQMIKRLVAAAFIECIEGKTVSIKNLQKPITPSNLIIRVKA